MISDETKINHDIASDLYQNKEVFIEQLIDDHAKSLINFCYTYVKDWGTAEDLVQDTLIKAYKKMHNLKDLQQSKTWLYSISANTCKDYLRKEASRKRLFTNLIEKLFKSSQVPVEVEDELINKEEANSIEELVLDLPIKYREIIFLYYYKELPTPEIAELLQVSQSTVRTRLVRGRDLLKNQHNRKGGSSE
ncbi:sigma-70 family RNA polymerase sigma factor [Aquibacillus koreensis]|uniref:RNA polymerase sigma factor n=1 Tax=Aquibacillus koreensis TaxID=279446 RepID=A0A9X3WNT7_9BACI|nr:sigma-70 family RNA polymerase sigma factor [Aquibacillus koreensis]MCT2536855.1 sigma-70 family RNA polymerase sigma factor [Aquibacillus koreensis]MDC3422013.1 sigma-70 family RNA polymerase sigma factor [Aquibacillus koreensis]